MSFVTADEEDDGGDGAEKITFLYKLVQGAAHRSYGLNVARLADLPLEVLNVAKGKSRELEEAIHARNTQREEQKEATAEGEGKPPAELSVFKDTLRLLQSGTTSKVEKQVLRELQKVLKGQQ